MHTLTARGGRGAEPWNPGAARNSRSQCSSSCLCQGETEAQGGKGRTGKKRQSWAWIQVSEESVLCSWSALWEETREEGSLLPPPTYPGVIFPLSTVQETEAPGETPLFRAAEQGQISHLLGPQSYSVL